MSVAVRPLTAEDRPAWDALWAGYLAFYRAEISAAVSDVTFTRMTRGEQGCFALVALGEGGAPVGLAHCIEHPSTWNAGPVVYLEDLFVARAARGLGAAKALIEAAADAAEARGAERLYWHTQQYNGAARSLYDTVGTLSSHVVYERELPAAPRH